MNKEEMQDIKERLELFPDNMNKEAQEGYYKLFNYIETLQQENKQLKDNWNKFKEWLENEVKRYAEDYENLLFSNVEYLTSAHILNKIQKLEKGGEE